MDKQKPGPKPKPTADRRQKRTVMATDAEWAKLKQEIPKLIGVRRKRKP